MLQVLDFEEREHRGLRSTEDSGPFVANKRESLSRVTWGDRCMGGSWVVVVVWSGTYPHSWNLVS